VAKLSLDTLAAVVLKEPGWSQLPTSTSDSILLLLQRCLKKDQRQRLQAIGEARISIDEVPTGTVKEERPRGLRAWPRFQSLSVLPWALLILFAITSAWFHFSGKATIAQTATLTAALIPGTDIRGPMISPHGTAVAFEHDGKLWLRIMKDLEPKAAYGKRC
jgi:hypothetical protein